MAAHPERQRRPGARGRRPARRRVALRRSSAAAGGDGRARRRRRAAAGDRRDPRVERRRRRADRARLRPLRRPAAGAARALGEPAVRADDARTSGSSRRGVADDKGQLYLLLKAARELAREGALPVNVRIACDGEEEIGGHSIVDWIGAGRARGRRVRDLRRGMPRRGQPAFYIATRGLCYFHVRVRTGERDLHSGVFGGAALNAMHALMRTLSRRPAGPDGRLPEPLRRGVVAADRRRSWPTGPRSRPGAEVLADQGAAADATRRAAEEFYVRTWARALGRRERRRGRLAAAPEDGDPGRGRGERLDPARAGPDGRRRSPRGRAAAARGGARGRRASRSSSGRRRRPGLVPPDSPAIRLGQDAFERALGTRPLLLRSGGTLPIVPALADKGIPTIVTGFDLPEGNIHSPNERLLVEHVPLGVAAAQELFSEPRPRLALGVPVVAGRGTSQSWPNRRIASITGSRPRPFGVSSYSTRGGVSGVAVPGDDALLLEPAQPLGERPRADAGAGVLELGEPARPLGEVVDEQRRPLRADDLGRARDRAGRVVHGLHRPNGHGPRL